MANLLARNQNVFLTSLFVALILLRLTMAGLVPFLNQLLGIGFICLYFLVLFNKYTIRRGALFYFLFVTLLAVFSAFTISHTYTGSFQLLLLDYMRYLMVGSIGYLSYLLLSERGYKVISRIFTVHLIFVTIMIALNYLSGNITYVHGDMRLSVDGIQIGQFGTLLSAYIIFFVSASINRPVKDNVFNIAIILLCLLLIYLNNTLRSILLLFITLVLVLVFEKRDFKLLLIMLVGGLLALVVNPEVLARLESLFSSTINPAEFMGHKLDNSLQWRIGHWYQVLADVWNNRFWTGYGMGNEYSVGSGYTTPDGVTYSVHSDFFRAFVEYGLVVGTLIQILVFGGLLLIRNKVRGGPHGLMKSSLVYFLGLAYISGSILTTISIIPIVLIIFSNYPNLSFSEQDSQV